ncbi:MAG: hypothetical protein NVS9B4_03150 [Candidatus Acidiferrum sp.]
MGAPPALAGELKAPAPRARGFMRIIRHGIGPSALYVLTYHRLDEVVRAARPVLAEGAQHLIELLESIGVDFRLEQVRGALEDVQRFGSANIPDLWFSDEEMAEKGLVDG